MDDNPVTPDHYRMGGVEAIDHPHAFPTEDESNGLKQRRHHQTRGPRRPEEPEDIRKARDHIGHPITGMKGEWS